MIIARLQDPPLAGLDDEELDALGLECVGLVDKMAEIVADQYRVQLQKSTETAPGAPPVRRSGRLYRSIVTRPARRKSKFAIEAEAGSEDGEYAARQEFGGEDSRGRMLPPHPWARPGEAAAAPLIDAMLQREIEDATPGA